MLCLSPLLLFLQAWLRSGRLGFTHPLGHLFSNGAGRPQACRALLPRSPGGAVWLPRASGGSGKAHTRSHAALAPGPLPAQTHAQQTLPDEWADGWMPVTKEMSYGLRLAGSEELSNFPQVQHQRVSPVSLRANGSPWMWRWEGSPQPGEPTKTLLVSRGLLQP